MKGGEVFVIFSLRILGILAVLDTPGSRAEKSKVSRNFEVIERFFALLEDSALIRR